MSNWISSKLKVAETFFEQIDQQAAVSLKKNDKARSEDEYSIPVSEKSLGGGGALSLKDQLKKRTSDLQSNGIGQGENPASNRNVGSQDSINGIKSFSEDGFVSRNGNGYEIRGTGKDSLNSSWSQPKPKPTLSDNDWTELLSSPAKNVSSPRSNAVSGIRMLRKVGNRQVDQKRTIAKLGPNFNQELKFVKKIDDGSVAKVDEKIFNREDSADSGGPSSEDVQIVDKQSESEILDTGKVKSVGTEMSCSVNYVEDDEGYKDVKNGSEEDLDKMTGFRRRSESDGESKHHRLSDDVHNASESLQITSRRPVANSLSRDPSITSDDESDSDSDSGSVSSFNSDIEREMNKRTSLLAEKAAARALQAIKERENIVARLEGEKQSLEKRLEDQAKRQAREASKLQTTMIETIEAAELEKQKHNSTRKEALIRLSKLEIANAHQARYLATIQKDLELELKQVVVLRQQMELKESTLQELTKMSDKDKRQPSRGDIRATRGFDVETRILEAEHSFLTDKIIALEEKAKKLEENMEVTRKEMEEPTEVEAELKRRLDQLTDYLIQKQAQVETLSSERATLVMRIERVSRLLEESRSTDNSKDLESGIANFSVRPMLEDKILAGGYRLRSAIQQVDSLFTTGAVFLRRNSHAKLFALLYLICLHFWVAYIMMAHSSPPDPAKSGGVFLAANTTNTRRR